MSERRGSPVNLPILNRGWCRSRAAHTNVDGEEMKQELIKTMKLGQPSREAATADGAQRVTSWQYADNVMLILADGTPMKIPGVYLTLLQQTKPSP